MFKPYDKKLKGMRTLAITTSTAEEKQLTTYCGPDEVVLRGMHLKICMANLASAIFFLQFELTDFKEATWKTLIDTANGKIEQ